MSVDLPETVSPEARLFDWLVPEHQGTVAGYLGKFDCAFGEATRTRLARAA